MWEIIFRIKHFNKTILVRNLTSCCLQNSIRNIRKGKISKQEKTCFVMLFFFSFHECIANSSGENGSLVIRSWNMCLFLKLKYQSSVRMKNIWHKGGMNVSLLFNDLLFCQIHVAFCFWLQNKAWQHSNPWGHLWKHNSLLSGNAAVSINTYIM